MSNLLNWLSTHKFQAHLAAFLLMTLPPIGLYLVATSGATGWIWVLLGLVIAGNLLALVTR